MEVRSYGKTKEQEQRDINIDILLRYCSSRGGRGCGRGERRCPMAAVCFRRSWTHLISDFTDEEIEEALQAISKDGGKR